MTPYQTPPSELILSSSFPPSEPTLAFPLLKDFLSLMWLIRRFEEKSAQIYTQGKIGGFCHLCIGQEAISVGVSAAMLPQDTMITAYRSHGHALARGLSARQVMCELMGKTSGCSKGKGGSMHLFHEANNFYGGHGIVGAQISLGTGLALSHKYLKDDGVSLIFMGDGATNQGQFFESMNMASLWDLPALYIIENNGYGMGTSVARACAGEALYKRGEPFDIPGFIIPGEDVIQVYETIRALSHRVRTQNRPLVLEIDTYRFKGHSMSDPGKYRSRQELDQARQSRDPLERLDAYLRDCYDFSEEDSLLMIQYAEEIVNDAFAYAEQDPEPCQEELFKDIIL